MPQEAIYLENLRTKLLQVLGCWGYEQVIPPMIDFIDSLLTGSGHDLDLQTFKLTDQVSGKTLGLRADMTPQVARMDAHQIRQDCPTRLCYVGTVLHTRGDPLDKTRSPMQIGAELYGHAGIESDVEIISLMLEVLAQSGILDVHLDLGHVGIFQALSHQARLTHEHENLLFDMLQRKARPELEEWLEDSDINEDIKQMIAVLPELNGGLEIINKARQLLNKADQQVTEALDNLETVTNKINNCFPALPISFDFAELRGYHYHTGVVFAAFVPMVGKEIARGGRYDNIGAVFGRARPATGFSADLKQLALLGKGVSEELPRQRIFAPYQVDDSSLDESIRDLRARGFCVIQQLPGQNGMAEELRCTAVLEQDNCQQWVVRSLA